jgi:hypothetical protein
VSFPVKGSVEQDRSTVFTGGLFICAAFLVALVSYWGPFAFLLKRYLEWWMAQSLLGQERSKTT